MFNPGQAVVFSRSHVETFPYAAFVKAGTVGHVVTTDADGGVRVAVPDSVQLGDTLYRGTRTVTVEPDAITGTAASETRPPIVARRVAARPGDVGEAERIEAFIEEAGDVIDRLRGEIAVAVERRDQLMSGN